MTEHILGSEERPLRVAVVGSGPSAFYAVDALFKTGNLHARVDVFERLPTPFGLVRGGVAPDHQNIKAVVKVYEKIAEHPAFRFFGNVRIGRDLTVADLEEFYDRVIWAVGNEADRRLRVPGEDLQGVHSATEFVGWYNGHPDFQDLPFDLERTERVVVVGNGNVAMDVARVLLRNPEELAKTDIADGALDALRRSSVQEVVLLGRRGVAQAAFSPKEIQELSGLGGVDLLVDPAEVELDPISATWLDTAAPRSAKRNVDFLTEQAGQGATGAARRVRCVFRASPVEILGANGRVRGVRAERNELVADDQGTPRPRGRGDFFELECEMVLRAVGYHGVPVPDVPFDERSGTIPNEEGRVLTGVGGERLPGHYVVGWAKRGPTGLIGTNSPDSKATVAALVADLTGQSAAPVSAGDADRVVARLRDRGIDFVSYGDWRALDAFERAEGDKRGKVRQKLCSVAELIAAVRRLRDAR
jgi:ferredoxin--NADP+ reductase